MNFETGLCGTFDLPVFTRCHHEQMPVVAKWPKIFRRRLWSFFLNLNIF